MTTRRAVLGGAVALAAPVSFAETTPDRVEPAELAFVEWINAVCLLHSWADRTDDDWLPVDKLESRLVFELAPAPSTAVVRLLHELAYFTSEHPNLAPASIVSMNERLPFELLRCLRASLTGRLAALVADILDNPNRVLADSLIGRAFEGTAPL